jgi:V8-like Glu-specific endopeptidase
LRKGDGGSHENPLNVMGVGHAGCANKAKEGKADNNVFSMLQKRANAALPLEERKAIIGYWCDNHKLDLVAGDVEDRIPYIGTLLHFLRSIV